MPLNDVHCQEGAVEWPMRRRVVKRTCRAQSFTSENLQNTSIEYCVHANEMLENARREQNMPVYNLPLYNPLLDNEQDDEEGLEFLLLGPSSFFVDNEWLRHRQIAGLRKHVRGVEHLLKKVHPSVDTSAFVETCTARSECLLTQRTILLTAIALEEEVASFFQKRDAFSAAVTRVVKPLYAQLVRRLFENLEQFIVDVSVAAKMFSDEVCWIPNGPAVPLFQRKAGAHPLKF